MLDNSINCLKKLLKQYYQNYHLPKDNEHVIQLLHEEQHIPCVTINDNIKAVGFSNLNDYCLKGYFLFQNCDGKIFAAINQLSSVCTNDNFIHDISNSDSNEIYLVKKNDFQQILERDFCKENTNKAIKAACSDKDLICAKNIDYTKAFTGFCIIFFTGMFCFINIFNVINCIIYFLQNIFKILLYIKSLSTPEESPNLFCPTDLPIYSILVPLYKEVYKAEAILAAIEKINYPKDKLDVKFLIEADDYLTNQAFSVLDVPHYVQIIKIPYSLPRTKPKALNYGLSFIRGKYLTVYDAEDEPEPNQLIAALGAFNKLPEEYICVQASLNFYNSKENFLTRLFSIEYSIWFEYLLKGLSILHMPVPLGGSSNHFKVAKLLELDGWDAHNVTEDADLGVRLHLAGYKTAVINSLTMEEAPNNLLDWIAQRARWIKGFIQTILVFARLKKNYKNFSLINVAVIYVFIGFGSYGFLFLPWLLTIIWFFRLHEIIYYLWLVNSFFALPYMYAISYTALKASTSKVKLSSMTEYLVLLLWPFYFLLHIIASYRAILELVSKPFDWNKTPHGSDEKWN